MDKIPLSELEKRISEAKASIGLGSRWQHYKGGKYIVKDVAIVESTTEVAVVYHPLEWPSVLFVRPLVAWQENVEYEGARVPRFQLLSEA